MRRIVVHIACLIGGALTLAGCGFADIRSPVPEFMRAKAPEQAPPVPSPDVKRIVRDGLETIFTAASHPTRVRVSAPLREPVGVGWTACVRAEISSVTGKPLTQTYRLTIASDMITDRRRIEEEDTCASENYEPV
jgi:hypothetical protein